MRNWLSLIIGLLILGGLNAAIWKNEKILQKGEALYLELAPVDPRSLMQGDYMRLAFAIERKIDKEAAKAQAKTGRLIIKVNEKRIGEFVDFYKDQPLKPEQKTIRYNKKWRWNSPLSIQPASYFFQEGHRQIYQRAKYGVFKYSDQHTYLLTALADENQTIIKPPEKAGEEK